MTRPYGGFSRSARRGRSSSEPAPVTWLPAAVAAVNGILVGSAMVATRVVVHEAGPASLALLRYAIGFCCLLPAVLVAGRVRFDWRDVAPIALLGITQFGVLIALLNYGLAFIPSARAALIFAVFPLLTMLLSAALGRERLTLAKSGGVLLTIVGVGLALGEKALARGSATYGWVGELAVFASALCGAVCSVLYRPYLKKYPTLPVSAITSRIVSLMSSWSFRAGAFLTSARIRLMTSPARLPALTIRSSACRTSSGSGGCILSQRKAACALVTTAAIG